MGKPRQLLLGWTPFLFKIEHLGLGLFQTDEFSRQRLKHGVPVQ